MTFLANISSHQGVDRAEREAAVKLPILLAWDYPRIERHRRAVRTLPLPGDSPGVADDLAHCLLPGPVRVAVHGCQELLEGVLSLLLQG